MAVTPHGVLHRDSHEFSPTIGGGVQVADFTRGFAKGNFTKCLLTFSYILTQSLNIDIVFHEESDLLRSQDVTRGSRPSLLRKTYPMKS